MTARSNWLRPGWHWVSLAALTFLLLFLVYPVVRVMLGSLTTPGLWQDFVTRAYYRQALLNSIWLALGATAGAVLLGVPLAVLVSRCAIPCKGIVQTLAVLSLLSPPFISAYAWITLLGRNGLLTGWLGLRGFSIYGPGGVLLVSVLHHVAYVFLLTRAALLRIDPEVEEVAESLGSPPGRRLLTITLPLALPAISGSGLLVFTSTLADFGTPMLIGEGMLTLPVVAYNEFLSELGGSTGMATVASLAMLLIALAALGVQAWLLRGRSYAGRSLRQPETIRLSRVGRVLGAIYGLLVAGVSSLPQAVVLVSSMMETRGPRFTGEIGLGNYRQMWGQMAEVVGRTLRYSGLAAGIMLVAGLLIAYVLVRRRGRLSRTLDGLLVLAQILPGTVLGVGLISAWGRPPVSLAGSGTILVVAYVVRRIAYTMRACAAGVLQLNPEMEEASLSLGVPPAHTFLRITVPLVLPAALSGALVSWIATLGELSSTIMLYTGRTATVSVMIYNQVLTSSFGTAAALGSLLIGLTLLVQFILHRWLGQDTPGMG